jgi:hypothetical protein
MILASFARMSENIPKLPRSFSNCTFCSSGGKFGKSAIEINSAAFRWRAEAASKKAPGIRGFSFAEDRA